MQWEVDRFGNRRLLHHFPVVERTVEFRVRLSVERLVSQAVVPCAMRDGAVFLEATPLTTPDARLRSVAAGFDARRLRGLELGDAVMEWVFGAMSYAFGATAVHTTAAQALAGGRGVCQDYAHIMLAVCRMCGLPARYVSGHMLGEGGTHAWVEILVPDHTTPGSGVAVAFDPTHNRRAGPTYITVAVGRDYRDVAPTSGSFRAPYGGQLTASKRAAIAVLEPYSEVAA